MKKYDIIVVGGGHAGVEAAFASVKLGCSTLLIDISLKDIGEMSCNPAVGGLGKGQLVKEIDAMGGVMGHAADRSCIQFKTLNMSKGPAVRSTRIQADRNLFKNYIQLLLQNEKRLDLLEAKIVDYELKKGRVNSVVLTGGERIYTEFLILTPGTFLNGTMYIGLNVFKGGRFGAEASERLSQRLKEDFRMLRFKTGTCARLDGNTIDFSKMIEQKGDKKIIPFSWDTPEIKNPQKSCYITHTNARTHEIIRKGFDRSPMITGLIEGTSVRYCPSIEDKLIKFPHHERHHVFLEPEGLDTDQYYPNGTFTSLPEDVQTDFLRSIPGLENVKINKYGYAIEHDVVDPRELSLTLQTKNIPNLFLAGQINGTTGYEEAAAQGLIAGINAASMKKSFKPFILARHEAYTGVLIDDLVLKGTEEPYRMFTSRAEYRLILREDNAHLRLNHRAHEYGLISEERYREVETFRDDIEKCKSELQAADISPGSIVAEKYAINSAVSAYEFLRRPDISLADLLDYNPEILDNVYDKLIFEINTQIKYEGYIKKQEQDIRRLKKTENTVLPEDIDYSSINGLSREEIEKLDIVRPLTFGQASRISGITPAALTSIMLHIKSNSQRRRK